jgi:ATP-dependent RNA helicase SUPV3L1/SUV3
MESENPLVELAVICDKTRSLLVKCNRIKAYYPAPDVALRKRLYDDAAELRRTAEEYVRKSAALVSVKYDHGADMGLSEVNLLSEATVKHITDKLVRSFVPDHPKDEFPRTRRMKRNIVIHCGETNTGKTYRALQALMTAGAGVYLAPLRLLALEIFQTLNGGGVPCSLLTGEERQSVEGARHISSTIEMLNIDDEYDVALIDEAQMIANPQRGSSWTKAILGVRAKEVIVCCSGNAVPLLVKLIESCGDDYSIVKHTRETPLVFEDKPFTFPNDVQPGDALIAFSRRRVLELAHELTELGTRASVIYGALPPENRRMQMQKFVDGGNSVVVATDAIGMGLNLPVKRIVFIETEKYNGFGIHPLTPGEIQQIAGRAGRRNMYDTGYVNAQCSRSEIESALRSELPELQYAYYHPVEQYVLSLPLGDLRQRLNACTSARDVEYIRNADLLAPMSLLTEVEEIESLTMQEQYRLIFIPFDTGNRELRAAWRSYVKLYSKGLPIPEPEIYGVYLDEWELAYKRLDLYHSFCRAMGVELDSDRVLERKREASEEIDGLLLKSLRKTAKDTGAK